MVAQIIPISDPSNPLATSVGATDLLLIDQVDATSLTGYKTKKVKNGLVGVVVNVQTFGADPTGTNDCSAALTAAFNSLPNITTVASAAGGTIYFPPGLYKFNSQVTLTLPAGWATVSIKGAGGAATVLYWPNASGGIVIDMSGSGGPFCSATVEGMKFLTGQLSGGNAVTLQNTGTNFSQLQTGSVFRDLIFWGDDSNAHYWTNAINIINVCNVNFDNIIINGNIPSSLGTGVNLAGSTAHSNLAVIFNFVNCAFTCLATGVVYGPWVQGVSFANCNFTTNGIGIWSPASEAGSLGQLLVTTSQFGMATSAFAIKMETAIEAVALVGNLFINNGSSNVGIQATAYARMQIVGNEFIAPGAGTAIAIGGTVLDSAASVIVADNTFDNFTTGITVAAGAKAVVIHDNSFRACATAITNSSTDTVNRIHDNIGYNPVGASAVTTAASPWTYTAGPSPETLYVSASTSISAVTQGGTSILPAATGANGLLTIQLGPNEPVVITYTGTLTAKKMVH